MEFLFDPGNTINALTLGSLYAMIAVGYTMVYGIIKLINFAHGEVFMFGAYIGLMIIVAVGSSTSGAVLWLLPVAILLAMLACAMMGTILDWAAYLPLRQNHLLPDVLSVLGLVGSAVFAILYFTRSNGGTDPAPVILIALATTVFLLFVASTATLMGGFGPPARTFESSRLSALITAIGMSLSLQTIAQLIWTANPQAIPDRSLPAFFNETVISITPDAGVQGKQLVIWITAAVLTSILTYLVSATKIGKAMRACAIDKQTASLMGVNVNHVIAFTFVVGSAMAAVAGILQTVKVGGNLTPRFGYYPGVIAFAAAVLGGIGNIRGAMLGGLLLGFTQSFAEGAGGKGSEYSFAFAFGLMVIVIIFRPWGLLGRATAKRA